MILLAVLSMTMALGSPCSFACTLALEVPAGCPTVIARTSFPPPASSRACLVVEHATCEAVRETTLSPKQRAAARADNVVAGIVR